VPFSNDSIADRIKQQIAGYRPQAQELELDRLRQEHGLLELQHKSVVKAFNEAATLLADCRGDLDTVLDFILASQLEIPEAVATIIAKREEARVSAVTDNRNLQYLQQVKP
jgi:hypothetical protein